MFGIETHVCVLQTVLDLLAQGQTVVVVDDCVSSRSANDKRIAIERMRQHGAIITTMESILFELLRAAGTDTFKAISAIVK
ncbi:MAG: isochorismatase family protein [Candidatus Kapaibacterium sp.]